MAAAAAAAVAAAEEEERVDHDTLHILDTAVDHTDCKDCTTQVVASYSGCTDRMAVVEVAALVVVETAGAVVPERGVAVDAVVVVVVVVVFVAVEAVGVLMAHLAAAAVTEAEMADTEAA